MAHSEFAIYKYVKLDDGSWRYKKAAFYSDGKIKPNVVIRQVIASGENIVTCLAVEPKSGTDSVT